MRVAILTMFNGLSTSYSLVNVVADQIQMLLDHQIEVTLLVSEQCSTEHCSGIYTDPRIQWGFVTNSINGVPIKWHDYSQPTTELHPSFLSELNAITPSLYELLLDADICIMHDILYQGWHYIHNLAIRQVSTKLPKLRFISFTHSFPLKRPIVIPPHLFGFYTPMANTLYIYPTVSGIPALANQYQIPEGDCRVVYNALSPFTFFDPAVNDLHQKVNLMDTDLLIIYPARLTPSKQQEKVAAFAGSLFTHAEKTVKIIFCDFPSSDIDSNTYKDMIYSTGESYGLEKEHIIFTSNHGYPNGFPRKAVLELFTLSNLFICPSYSESFGLTILEAASRGNFLVVNKCVPALEELGTQLNAYFLEWPAKTFEGQVIPHYIEGEAEYYRKHVKKLMHYILQDRTFYSKTQVRLQYSPQWIWHNQLGPLLQPFQQEYSI